MVGIVPILIMTVFRTKSESKLDWSGPRLINEEPVTPGPPIIKLNLWTVSGSEFWEKFCNNIYGVLIWSCGSSKVLKLNSNYSGLRHHDYPKPWPWSHVTQLHFHSYSPQGFAKILPPFPPRISRYLQFGSIHRYIFRQILKFLIRTWNTRSQAFTFVRTYGRRTVRGSNQPY